MRDEDFMQPDGIINYGSLVQEYMCEYFNIFDSKQWEPTNGKKKSIYETLLIKASTVAIEYQVNKNV